MFIDERDGSAVRNVFDLAGGQLAVFLAEYIAPEGQSGFYPRLVTVASSA